jgi:hypothetical protein
MGFGGHGLVEREVPSKNGHKCGGCGVDSRNAAPSRNTTVRVRTKCDVIEALKPIMVAVQPGNQAGACPSKKGTHQAARLGLQASGHRVIENDSVSDTTNFLQLQRNEAVVFRQQQSKWAWATRTSSGATTFSVSQTSDSRRQSAHIVW